MGLEEEKITHRTRREFEEEHTPLWIKIFGGSILSITFLCVITLTGYIVSSINNIQSQLNSLNTQMTTKTEFKVISDSIKVDSDNISSLKERMNVIENSSKDRQVWMEKQEIRVGEQYKSVELANGLTQKEIQTIRERIATIEGKIGLLPEKKNN